MTIFTGILEAFIIGLAAPLTAVCILPLYPGFLSFLASRAHHAGDRKTIFYFGLIVASGVILFMLLFGLIFSTILQQALTPIIGIVSPIAFAFLGIVSIMLIFNFDFGKILPQIQTPITKSPKRSAFVFGFFFGAIIIPCNPGIITLFLARQFLQSSQDIFVNLVSFLFFGIGISTPLLIFAAASARWDKKIISWLIRHKRAINITVGAIMLYVSLYYLLCVFSIQENLRIPLGPLDDWFCTFNNKFVFGPFEKFFGKLVPT